MLGNRDDNCIKQEREGEGRGSLTASLNGMVDGMARTPQARKALWAVAFVLVIAALVFGVRLTYSAFSANDHLKAVAVTGTSQSLFASDVLAPYSTAPDSPAAKSVVVDTSGETCSFTFRVYNCMLDDRNVFNDKEVEYKLDVKASGINGDGGAIDSGWRLSSVPEEKGETVVLPGTQAKIVTYTVSFDRRLLNSIKFAISANVVKDKSPGTNLTCLAATVTPAERSEVKSASVSVTGKQQTVALTWGENVELDPHFAANHTDCAINAANRTVTFAMSPGSEIVSFYWTGGSARPSNWDDLGVSVKASS